MPAPGCEDWSRLAAVLEESGASIERAVAENTADKAAEERFLRHVENIVPRSRVAEQALRDKLLSVPDFEPDDETSLLWRRFQAEAELFRPENVPLQTELAKQANQYAKLAGAMEIQWDGAGETLPQAELHLMEPNREATRACLAPDHEPLAAGSGPAQRALSQHALPPPPAGAKRRQTRLPRPISGRSTTASTTAPPTATLSMTPSNTKSCRWPGSSTRSWRNRLGAGVPAPVGHRGRPARRPAQTFQ